MAELNDRRPVIKVVFEQSGGFVGLVKGCELDADCLPPDVGAELRRLVASSGLDVSSEGSSPGARDRRRHAITIDRDGEKVHVVCDDGSTPEGARGLVAFLAAQARPMRP